MVSVIVMTCVKGIYFKGKTSLKMIYSLSGPRLGFLSGKLNIPFLKTTEPITFESPESQQKVKKHEGTQ